ncbi:hypothetical protein LCGC14_1302330 [marine sediment metagenome]|uniref:Uncharacterized protein n=1 Tax=marine sediment metagenome TaxID=412755 RepID=A0A0F9KPL1_9ZZZZ
MKRKVKVDENLPRWQKISGGTLYLSVRGNHRIKPGEKIRCTAEEISRTMPDNAGVFHFKLIEEGKGEFKLSKKARKKAAKLIAEEKKAGETIPDKDIYTVVHIKGGWHNVESSIGKVMNDKKLRADDAQQLKEDLETETPED